MKRRALVIFLTFEAMLCMLLYLVREAVPTAFGAAMAFPFEQLGMGLRALSLSGGVGNLLSIVIYAALCLIPAMVLLLIRKKRRLQHEDVLLGLLSAVLFAVLYFMINPGMLGKYLGSAAGQSLGKAMLGGMVYSVLCSYLVLRILRLFFAADTGKLQKYLIALLYVLNALFVYLAFGACFADLLDAFQTLRKGNAGNEHLLGASYVFLVLKYLVDALPYVLNVLVVFSALRLLDELGADRYSEAAVAAAEKLSLLCGFTLAVTVLSNIALNLLQLIFVRKLMTLNSSLQIPVLSIAFVLATLLMARFIGENKQLKDDYDMFI